MGATSVMSGLAGVSACVVGDKGGAVIEHTGADVNPAAVLGAVEALVAHLRVAGSLLGLGEPEFIATKGADCAWVAGTDASTVIVVRVAAGRSTSAVEAAVARGNWSASIEFDVSDSDLEYISTGERVPRSNPSGLRPTQPAPSEISRVAASVEATPAEGGTLERASASAEGARDADSGLKWRTAPKYRAVMLQPPRIRRIEAPAPAVRQPPLMRPPVPATWDDENSEITRSSGRTLTSAPAFAGGLQTVCFPDLLEFLRVGQRTGTMVCSSAAGTGRVHLRSGRLLAASSPTTRPLPGYLVANGAATQEVLNGLPEISSGAWSGPGVGPFLASSGVVTVAQVRQALGEQIRDALTELMTWSDGEFSFDADPAVDAVPSNSSLEFDPQAMLLQIHRHQDELSQAAK